MPYLQTLRCPSCRRKFAYQDLEKNELPRLFNVMCPFCLKVDDYDASELAMENVQLLPRVQ